VTYINTSRIVGAKNLEDSLGVVRRVPEAILSSVNADLGMRPGSQLKAPVTLDQLALARAVRSEHGSESLEVQRWVAWAIKNSARKAKMSIFRRLTESKNRETSGLFARQRVDARYAATNQDARLEDLLLAQHVLASNDDPTDGATNFFSPKTQDALYALAQKGDARYVGRITRDAEATRKLWESRGLESRGAPPGVPSGVVEFFA
jgi:hypothetical protein